MAKKFYVVNVYITPAHFTKKFSSIIMKNGEFAVRNIYHTCLGG